MTKSMFLSPKSSILNSTKGFTLIELLITITIMSALSIVGIYFSLQTVQKQRVISAADVITTALDTARSLSVSVTSDQSWAVSFSTLPNPSVTQYCFSCAVGQQQPKKYNLPKQVSFGTLPSGNLIIFQKYSGRASGPTITDLKTTNTTIPLTITGWSINVIVPPHGTVYQTTIAKFP